MIKKQNIFEYILFILLIFSIVLSSILFFENNNKEKGAKVFYQNNIFSEIEICCSNDGVTAYGTATCVGDDTFITCAHVVLFNNGVGYSKFEHYQYRFADEKEYSDFELIRYNIEKDIALIKIESNKEKPVSFKNDVLYEVGDNIYALGNAYNQGISLSRGVISTNELIINNYRYICSDNSISGGCSGGGLFLENGLFIGLISSRSDFCEWSYSLTIKEIFEFLEEEAL